MNFLSELHRLLEELALGRSPEQVLLAIEQSARLLSGGACKILRNPVPAEMEADRRFSLGNPKHPLGWLILSCGEEAIGEQAGQLLALIATVALQQEGSALETRRMMDEQDFAVQILREMLPPEPLLTAHCSAAGRLDPCEAMGGDCYNYVQQKGKIHFFLADAVGHGLGSTLLVYECRAAWRALSLERASVRERALLLNNLLFHNTGAERFVACFLASLDLKSGLLSYANCGIAPVFYSKRNEVEILEAADPPLGLFPEQTIHERQLTLLPGDSLLIATDGILDWHNREREFYGEQRVAQLLQENASSPPGQLLDALFSSLQRFGGYQGQRDDACALFLRYEAPIST